MEKNDRPVVIVTGGGSGIGRAFCEELARRGWSVVVADLRREDAERVAAGITGTGGRAVAHHLDVAEEKQVEALVTGTAEAHGRLDMLINNAGVAVVGEIDDIDLARWRRILDVNLWSQVVGCYHAMRVMREQGYGRIVNVASGLGLMPTARRSAYVTGKYGSVGLSQALRPEAAAYGIKVSAICPGPVRTPILETSESYDDPETSRRRLRRLERWIISTEQAVRRYLRGLARDRAIIIGSGMGVMWWIHRLNPAIVERLVGRREMTRHLARLGRAPRWNARDPREEPL